MSVYESVIDLVGNTPLLKADKFKEVSNLGANIFAKLELFNPSGSAKDRIAKAIIEDAEEKGIINKSSVLIEPTSGNTGIGLAAAATAKGYRIIIVMPETMSAERRKIMKAYGAELVLSDGKLGMSGAIKKANELAKEIPDSFIPSQFTNPVNPLAHYKTTGPEIWKDTLGNVDAFIAGVGTGGTLSGVGKFLKEQNKNIKIIAVEPAGSPVLSQGHGGKHAIQGIGAGFVPETLDTKIYDEVIAIEDADAVATSKKFASSEGLSVGISAGAALKAAEIFASREENKGKNIVVLLPDGGDRYFSTALFDFE